ncbi:MAG: 50S ribosomal protein L4 [Planctomycetes bacterium]|nr:50S ribosomal protein L4 [Planctomycetota bacterium]
MIQLPVHDQSGNATGEVYSFDETEIASEVNAQLLHAALVMYDANQRLGTVKSKSRAEVSGSSKKLFKQKGTGNARAGNKRTPVRRGGGHCFAKRPKDWRKAMPRKARQAATRMAILGKLKAGTVVVLNDLKLESPKTKKVASLLTKLGLAGKSAILTIASHDDVVWKSCRNIDRLGLSTATDLNAGILLKSSVMIATKGALDVIRSKAAS